MAEKAESESSPESSGKSEGDSKIDINDAIDLGTTSYT